MAHEIEIVNGKASAMFVGKPAWHDLGQVFQTAPDIDTAIAAGGLGWNTITVPATRMANGVLEEIPGQFEIRRETDSSFFAFVGKNYTTWQNSDMANWYRPIIEGGHATIEAAGSLRGGKRVWILAAVKGGEAEIVKGDSVKHYILMANGHDGTLAITCGFTSIRVVCMNTLSAALNTKGAKLLKVRHTSGAKLSLEKIRAAFDIQAGELRSQASAFQYLASKKCDDDTMVKYAREVLSPGADDDRTVRNLQKPLANFAGAGAGAELPGVRGTMWGAFNAVTEFITHQAGRSSDTRVESGWFGANAKMTDRALNVALEFAEHAPDAAALARQCDDNFATAGAEFGALLGKPVRATFDTAAE